MFYNLKKYREKALLVALVSFVVALLMTFIAHGFSEEASSSYVDRLDSEYSYLDDYDYDYEEEREFESARQSAAIATAVTYLSVGTCSISVLCYVASGLLIAYRKDVSGYIEK